jgi:hypothetical protein
VAPTTELKFIEELAETAASSVYDDERGPEFIERHIQIWDQRHVGEADALSRGQFLSNAELSPATARASQELLVFAAESELKTWMLLRHLRQVEDIVSSPEYAAVRAQEPSASDRTNAARLAELLIQQDPELLRCQAVVDWLEETAAHAAPELTAVTLRRTLTRLTSLKAVGRADVPYLDFDTDTRRAPGAEPVTDTRDAEDERAVLAAAWRSLRAGRADAAAELFASAGLSWRAASLTGDAVPGLAPGGHTTGNAAFLQFKQLCRALAQAPGAGAPVFERAIYGVIAGAPGPALAACGNWADACWVLLKCHIGATVDAEVTARLRAAAVTGFALSSGSNSAPAGTDADPVLDWLCDRYELAPAPVAGAAVPAAVRSRDLELFGCGAAPEPVDSRCSDAAAALAELRRIYALPADDDDAALLARPAADAEAAYDPAGDADAAGAAAGEGVSAREFLQTSYRLVQELLVLGRYADVEAVLARRLAAVSRLAGNVPVVFTATAAAPAAGGRVDADGFSFGATAHARRRGASATVDPAQAAQYAAVLPGFAAFAAHVSLYLCRAVPAAATATPAGASVLAAHARALARARVDAAVPVYCDMLPARELVCEYARYLGALSTTEEQREMIQEAGRFPRLRTHLLSITKQLVQTVLTSSELADLTAAAAADVDGAAPTPVRRAAAFGAASSRRASAAAGGLFAATPGRYGPSRGGSTHATPVARLVFGTPGSALDTTSASGFGTPGAFASPHRRGGRRSSTGAQAHLQLGSPGGPGAFLASSEVVPADTAVSAADAQKIAVVACFEASSEDPAYLLEALLHTNGLMRFFVFEGRMGAVRELARQTTPLAARAEELFGADMTAVVDPVAGNALVRGALADAGATGAGATLSAPAEAVERVASAESYGNAGRELLAWRFFLTCLDWLEAWRLHHEARPAPLLLAPERQVSTGSDAFSADGGDDVEVVGGSGPTAALRKQQLAAQRAHEYAYVLLIVFLVCSVSMPRFLSQLLTILSLFFLTNPQRMGLNGQGARAEPV